MEDEEEKKEAIELNNLPKDIIFDIFSRIPLKKLCQITCVCKKWLILVSLNQEFRSFYHKKHKISPLLMLINQNNETPSTQISSYSIDGTQQPQFSTIFPNIQLTFSLTSNGIISLFSETHTFLHDPVSKRVLNLPNSSHMKSSISFAFGHMSYNLFTNVYKLIHFYTIERFNNFHYCQKKIIMSEILTIPGFDIRSSYQVEWRSLGKCPYNVLGRKDHACVGQKIYWLIGEKTFNLLDDIKIMSFHLQSEMFGIVCFPRTCSDRSIECLDLVEIKDKLCLTDRLPWGSTMDIWMMMKEDDFIANNWCKKYKIDLKEINHHDVRIMGYLNKINDGFGDDNNGDLKDEILIKFGSKSYGVYDLDHGLFRDFGCGINFDGWDFNLFVDRKHIL